MQVNMTPQHAQTLMGFIDIGVRQGGLNVAAQGLELAQILQKAIEAEAAAQTAAQPPAAS